MYCRMLKKAFTISTFLLSLLVSTSQKAEACSRILFNQSGDLVITARSMDWFEDIQSDLWIFPRGIKRHGHAGDNSIEWTSKYGSVITSGYNAGTADGMNEKGLVANVLYLIESDFGTPNDNHPKMSIMIWAQYVLDNFATVKETVDNLQKEHFKIIPPALPDGSRAHLHLSISDEKGDSAIFEYLNGKLVIHHGKEFAVMTNSPTFDKQLALEAYWDTVGGVSFLPGTNRAADRFARASYLLRNIPKTISPNYITAVPDKNFENQTLSSMLGIVRSVSIPLGVYTPGEPNIASTLWRTVSDQKNKIYYFDSATSPNTFWVELKDVDFNVGASIKKLTTSGGKIYSGNVAANFEPAKPFQFMHAK